MTSVHVVFSRPRSKYKIFANLIMWSNKTDFSHASTHFGFKFITLIYQNSGHHTNFVTATYFNKVNEIVEVYALPYDEIVFNRMIKMCTMREGTPYGGRQIFGKAIVIAWKWLTTKDIKNPFSDGDRTTDCIEESYLILKNSETAYSYIDMDTSNVKQYRDFVRSLPNVKRIL